MLEGVSRRELRGEGSSFFFFNREVLTTNRRLRLKIQTLLVGQIVRKQGLKSVTGYCRQVPM